MSKFWSQRTLELDPYTPGEQPKDNQYIKLNTNENPYPPSQKVQQAIIDASNDQLRLYSDPNSTDLKQSIADYYHVDTKQVFVGNGSDEVLAHAFVALLKQDDPLLFPDISYSFYPVYCQLFGIQSQKIPLDKDFSIQISNYAIKNGGIIFPNPNAPTGKALGLNSIEKMLDHNKDSVVVIDEAYVDFGAESAIALVDQYPNLLVIQTLSKSRSLAGLRVGFAVGHADLIEGLERVKNSFNSYPLATNAIAGAVASMQDTEAFEENCQKIINTREYTQIALKKLGFQTLDSRANFIFAKPPQGYSAESLYLNLKKKNILVRYFKIARINQFLRITIGTDQEMDHLIEALGELLNKTISS
ncbi:MAG: histidinol-phosphate transaminase [Thiotrichaceae bacterium]|nr:histidinol-phosphate transaminase [Thiotrichaceae bacterium]